MRVVIYIDEFPFNSEPNVKTGLENGKQYHSIIVIDEKGNAYKTGVAIDLKVFEHVRDTHALHSVVYSDTVGRCMYKILKGDTTSPPLKHINWRPTWLQKVLLRVKKKE